MSDEKRVKTYVDAMTGLVFDETYEVGYQMRHRTAHEKAERAIAVADAEQAELKAEVENLKAQIEAVTNVAEGWIARAMSDYAVIPTFPEDVQENLLDAATNMKWHGDLILMAIESPEKFPPLVKKENT
jgi:hypothetical protein